MGQRAELRRTLRRGAVAGTAVAAETGQKIPWQGSIWEALGEVFGRDLDPLGASWAVVGLFFSCLYLEWSSKVLLEPSGLDFGSILMDFGKILGWSREGLGGICEHSG